MPIVVDTSTILAFLSLAKKQKCPLITLDMTLQKLAFKIGLKIIEVNNDDI